MKITKNNIFWDQVLVSWTKICNAISPSTFEDILSVNIWNNKDIKIANKPIFYKHWYDKHIYHFKKIINEDAKFDFQIILSGKNAVEKYIKSKQIVTQMPY